MTLVRFALFGALALSACSPAPVAPARPPLEGARIGGPFTLTDQNGRSVSDRDFAGKYRIMYFGYTFCPDVCPTDVQAIGAALKSLERTDPAVAAKIVPIFVTVDPTRDTPAVLKAFVSAFHPRMVGLTGTVQQIEGVKKEFAVFSAKGDPSPGGGYLVNHSRQAYLMAPDGKPIALLPQEQGPQAVADEIKRWVS
ncbi:SCO family protein [Sphingomonas sp. R86521]|uniref:SCO family protein n=1 Tax=Sphingomonas sp. R86521 TaxID=3093860 RepID=UPI0036D34BC5